MSPARSRPPRETAPFGPRGVVGRQPRATPGVDPGGPQPEATEDQQQMRTGSSTSTFIIFQSPEEGIGFPMSLKGFGDGYDKLH